MKREPTLSERLSLVANLRLKAVERYGLEQSHPVVRNVDRLERYWDREVLRQVELALERLEVERLKLDLPVSRMPSPEAFEDGDLLIGQAANLGSRPTQVRIPNGRFPLHWLIAGVPGAGKTTFVRLVLRMIVSLWPWIRIILFDPSRSYATLCSDPRLWVNIPWADLRLAPFCAPLGFPYSLWLPQRVDALCRGELKHSRYLILRRLDALFAGAAIPSHDDGACPSPSLVDLRNNLASQRERPGTPEDRYRASALNVLDGRVRTAGSVFDCARGMEDPLTSTRACIDTHGLSPQATIEYLETAIVQYAFCKRMLAPRIEPPELHTLVVVEEAQNVVGKHPSSDPQLYHELLLQSRSLGLGFMFIAHDLENADNTIFSAISNFALFAQSSAANKKLAANLLNLSSGEAELLGRLSVGNCLVRMVGHSKWPHPFVMRVTP